MKKMSEYTFLEQEEKESMRKKIVAAVALVSLLFFGVAYSLVNVYWQYQTPA